MAGSKNFKNIEGFALRISAYKENDAMVTVLSGDGLFSFLARGVQKSTSKNFASCTLLAKAKYSLNESASGNLTLAESEVLSVPDGGDDLIRLSLFSLISEICLKLVSEEEAASIYPWLEKAMEHTKEKGKEASAVLILLCHVLKGAGYALEVDGCVKCGSKTAIQGVSFNDGGFVCKDCVLPSEKLDTRNLKILRFCFKCELSDMDRVSFENKESVAMIRRLAQYIDDYTGVKLKSLSLLTNFAF
ncbi:MAG: DNA repair protein RecO [Bacilli bacterium]|nr:DNA repair protein RecO [Bacilli bacterium]